METANERVVRASSDVRRPRSGRFARAGGAPVRTLTRAALGLDIGEGNAPAVVARRDAALRRLLGVADLLAALVAMVVSVTLLGDDALNLACLAILPVVAVSSRLMGLYDRDEVVLSKTTLNEGPPLFHLATLCTVLVYVGQDWFIEGHLGPEQGVGLWAAFFVAACVSRSLIRHLAVAHAEPERCIVVGQADRLARVREKLHHGWALNAEVVRSIPITELGTPSEARALLEAAVRTHDAHRVIVATGDLDNEELLAIIRDMKALGVKVSVQPRLLDVIGSAVEFEDVHGDVFLGLRRFGLNRAERRTKRVMDLVGATILLLAVAPFLIACAIAIKLDSRGPVIFRQERVGRDGRRFLIWKLRTMVVDAEERQAALMSLNEAEGGLFKMTHDPRVTRVGRLLRRTALDELPQLWNVVRGQMSLVGPRPLIAAEDRRIGGWHRRRLDLTPGMTGMWQVLGSARIPLRDMVALDYLYIVNWSAWNDLQILLRTVSFVLRGRGM